MSYGAEFRNELGELIIDDGVAMYERARGYTHKPRTFENNTPTNGNLEEYLEPGPWFTKNVQGDATRWPRGRFVSAAAVGRKYGYKGNSPPYPRNFISPSQIWGYGDLGFYRLSSGGVYYYAGVGFDDGYGVSGTFHYLAHDQPSSEIEYRFASTVPATQPPEGYGLQTFDSVGNVTFDSRHKQLPILKNLYVTGAQLFDVMDKNQPLDIALGMAIANAWVATPQWASWYARYQYGEIKDFWAVKITQLNDTTLRLVRHQIEVPFNGYHAPGYSSFTHDATILVAPNPA